MPKRRTPTASRPAVSRRDALAGLGLLGGMALASAPAQARKTRASARKPVDFADPRQNLDAYVKLVADVSGRNIVGWFSGHIFGVVEKRRLEPLFGFEGFGVGRYEKQPDGSYHNIWREVGYYKDIDTGRILEQWRNPYSQELVDVLHVQNDPVNLEVRNTTPRLPPIPGLDFRFGNYGHADKFVLPWLVDHAGDWASCMYDVHGLRPNPLPPQEWPRESSGPTLRVSEMFQYGGALSELEDPAVTSVRSVGGWQRIADWLPWMVMDQRPGHLMYRAVMRKLARVEDLPAHVLDYTQKHFANFLTPPAAWQLRNVSSFDVYKAKRKPLPPK